MGSQAGNHDVLEDVVDELLDDTGTGDVSVDDVLSAVEDRSFGALVTVIGLIAATPIVGGIPGISILCGILCLLVAGQHALGMTSPWIPSVLRNRSIERDKLESGLEKVKPWARWIDGYIRPRLALLVGGHFQRRLIAILICILALTMFPLALVPWGVMAPALAIMLLGIAIIGRDGLVAAIALGLAALTAYLMFAFRDTLLGPFS